MRFVLVQAFNLFRRSSYHTLVGLDNGNLLVLGGYDYDDYNDASYFNDGDFTAPRSSSSHIWELNGEWTMVGNLKNVI